MTRGKSIDVEVASVGDRDYQDFLWDGPPSEMGGVVMGRSYQQIAESFRIGGEIAVEFFEAHLRAPSIREYTELAMERGGICYDAIRNHHGTYLKWLASVGVQPNPATGFTKNKSGNDLWQRLNTMTDSEFRSLAAEMFSEVDWDAKGAYGSRS